MSNSSNDENLFIVIAVVVLGLFALVIWKFSVLINVNFETGFSVFLRACIVLAICITVLKLDILSLGQAAPALIGCLAWSFFPALDYWSAQEVGGIEFSSVFNEQMWYSRWYSKAAFVLLPILGGYSLRFANSR